MKKFFLKKEKGFTLIETLVAITILLIAIVGPMEIASKGLFSAFYARDEITAYYLAQEGLEYVRNGRDTVFLENNANGTSEDWLSGLSACEVASETDDGCYIDVPLYLDQVDGSIDSVITECSGECPVLLFNETNGSYSYTSGDDSKFTRTIKISREGADEAVVESQVTWTVGTLFSSTKSFTLKERIFNWLK